MTTSAIPVPTTRPSAVTHPASPALETPLARRLLGEAVLLGVSADALLRTSIAGAALPVWIALVAAALIAVTWRAGRRVPGETAAWLAVAVAFAATVAWREAELLRVAGVFATLGALVMAAISSRDRRAALRAARVRDTIWAARTVVLGAIGGMLPLALREAVSTADGSAMARRASAWTRAAVIALALLVVFGALLRGADPVFASLVALPDFDVATLVSHLLLIGFFAWITGGWGRSALDERDAPPLPTVPTPHLATLELNAALGTLNVLFGLFVITQAGWFFGGETFLRERTGLTAATYARQGFFQMVWVVLLLIPVLIATRATLGDDRALQRRHTRLALPLLALLAVMVLSAASRMQLYVHYYGLTIDRLYPLIFMGWLAVVLAWFAWTVLRDRGDRFVAGTIVSALAVLAATNMMVPDVIAARVNIARASGARGDTLRTLDLEHLASLSGEAVPLAVEATLAPVPAAMAGAERTQLDIRRCDGADELLRRWGPTSRTAESYREDGAWRRWNRGESLALGSVSAAAPSLRAIHRTACAVKREYQKQQVTPSSIVMTDTVNVPLRAVR